MTQGAGILEVAAAVVVQEGRVLITQRRDGWWEFPGGKLEPGESPAQALVRELEEELGVMAQAGPALMVLDHTYPDRKVRLHFIAARLIGGTPRPLSCRDIRWVEFSGLGEVDFLEADRRFVGWLGRRKTEGEVDGFWSFEMKREVMWISLDERKFEHLCLTGDEDGVLADGMIIHLDSEKSFRIRYLIRCDPAWRVREVELRRLYGSEQSLVLHSDGDGRWTNDRREGISSLDGCLDIDIYYSPFTNTLAIRRLALKPGQSAETDVAFISVPEMTVTSVRQRYECLESTSEGGLYRYEGLASGFTAELPVDSDGLLLEYPKFFRRSRAR